MIKFKDLIFLNMDVRGDDEISVIIDGGAPDRMLAKSAKVIYGNFYVVWFSGSMYGLSEEAIFVL